MSELSFQQMTNEELIDFALEHIGQEHKDICTRSLTRTFFED